MLKPVYNPPEPTWLHPALRPTWLPPPPVYLPRIAIYERDDPPVTSETVDPVKSATR
jgi:hypothetical protein